MDLINETGLKAAWIPGKIRHPSWSVTFVVKGTFDLRPGEPAQLSKEQPLPTGDEHIDGDLEKALRYPNDFGLFKPGADLMLVGHCHAPGGGTTDVCTVKFQVGGFQKSLAVIGNRIMKRGLLASGTSGPAPFTVMDLSYANAFGGPGCATNPIGTGFADETGPRGERYRRLPNVEDPARLVRDWDTESPPAGFGPIPMMWPQRMSRAGTYGKKWQRGRWPFFPEDFDWSFFNAAPPDQQLKGYLRGGEELFFENLHPEHARYRSKLPGLRVRCFTVEFLRATEHFREVPMVLDTLWVDMDAEKLTLVWHGNRDVEDEKHRELYMLYVVTEPLAGEPRTLDHHRAGLRSALERALERTREFEAEPSPLEPAPPPAEPAGPSPELPEPSPPDASALQADAAKAEAEALAAIEKRGQSFAGPPQPPPTAAGLLESLTKAVNFAKEKLLGAGRPIPPELTDLAAAMPSLVAAPESIEASPEAAEEPEEPEEPTEPAEPAEPEAAPITREDVLGRIERREPLDQLDMTEMDLSGLDLAGMSLAGAILGRARLRGAVLAGATLDGASLAEADLVEANLKEARLAEADLAGAKLARADLSAARLPGADLSGADLRGARLVGASAPGSLLAGADLSRADLTGADLTEANATRARLHGTILTGATLEGCCLQKTWGRRLVADRAVVTRLKAAGARLPEASFREARGEQSVWDGAQLYRADFTSSCIDRAEFSSAYLEGARFTNANVRTSRFVEASLRRAYLTRANLFRCNLEKADLTDADLTQANCYGSEFLDVVRERARFDDANLKMTKLSGGAR